MTETLDCRPSKTVADLTSIAPRELTDVNPDYTQRTEPSTILDSIRSLG